MELNCWQCGALLKGVLLPLSRREECSECRAEIHACRQCEHYDVQVSNQCREDRAEQVSGKTSANFCDYFQLRPQPPVKEGQQEAVSPELAALFGLDGSEQKEPAVGNDPANPLDDLFK